MSDQQVVVVTGMHRSGTSLVASMLQEAGVNVGRVLLGPYKGNPRGHFEDVEFYRFHEYLLRRSGIPSFFLQDPSTLTEPDKGDRDEASRLIEARSALPFWGWKDPRTCLFLDFWASLLPDCRYVFIYRHPLEVVVSLLRRATDLEIVTSPALGLSTWWVYNNALLTFLQAHPERCLLCHISTVAAHVPDFLRSANAKLGLTLDTDAGDGLLQPDELHFVEGVDSAPVISTLKALYPEVAELYSSLQEHADLPAPRRRSRVPHREQLQAIRKLVSSQRSAPEIREAVPAPLLSLLLSVLAPDLADSLQTEAQTLVDGLRQNYYRLNTLPTLMGELSARSARAEQLEAALEQRQVELEHALKSVQESNAEVDVLRNSLTDSVSRAQRKDDKIKDLEATLKSREEEIEAANECAQETQTEVDTMKVSLTDLEADSRRKDAEIESLKTTLEIRDAELAATEKGAHFTETEVHALRDASSALQAATKRRSTEIEHLEATLKERDEELHSAKAKLHDSLDGLRRLQEARDVLETESRARGSTVAELEAASARHGTEVASLTQLLDEKAHQIEHLEGRLRAVGEEADQAETGVSVLRAQQDRRDEIAKELEQTNARLESELDKLVTSLDRERAQTRLMGTDLRKYRSRNLESSERIRNLERQLASTRRDLDVVYRSRSWRLVRLYWGFRDRLRILRGRLKRRKTAAIDPSRQAKIAFVLPDGLNLGGVTIWSVGMSSRLLELGRRALVLRHINLDMGLDLALPEEIDAVTCSGQKDASATTLDDLEDYLGAYDSVLPATIIPNYNFASYATCSLLSQRRSDQLRILGYCHSDETFYYQLLFHYEPMIHRFVCVSREATDTLVALLPHRAADILTLPYAVGVPANLERSYSAEDQPLRLVYAGRIVQHQKRIFSMLDLVEGLTRQGVRFELQIVGTGPDEDEFLERLGQLSPETRRAVSLTGTVPPEKMKGVWETSDVLILVSEWEGTSISMLESMACGCVPVVTRVSGTRDVVEYGKNGFLSEYGDLEQMVRHLKLLDVDRELLRCVGLRAHRSAAERHSYDQYLHTFSDIVDDAWKQSERVWPTDRPVLPNETEVYEQIRPVLEARSAP